MYIKHYSSNVSTKKIKTVQSKSNMNRKNSRLPGKIINITILAFMLWKGLQYKPKFFFNLQHEAPKISKILIGIAGIGKKKNVLLREVSCDWTESIF